MSSNEDGKPFKYVINATKNFKKKNKFENKSNMK